MQRKSDPGSGRISAYWGGYDVIPGGVNMSQYVHEYVQV